METGADGLSVAEVAEHSTMDCARCSADHLMDPYCTFDGGLLEGGLLEGVHLFFVHIEELDFGWRKDMEGYHCGCVPTVTWLPVNQQFSL